MEYLVLVILIAAFAFWLGRRTKPTPSSSDDGFARSAIQSNLPASQDARIPMNGARLFSLIFLLGWIIAWSAGIVMALMMWLNSFGEIFFMVFLGGWLLAAIAGWILAANTIYKLATGKPVKGTNGQGD